MGKQRKMKIVKMYLNFGDTFTIYKKIAMLSTDIIYSNKRDENNIYCLKAQFLNRIWHLIDKFIK